MELKIETLEYAQGAMLEYIVHDAEVVYCGTTDIRSLPERASTTNAAAKIVRVLAKAIGSPVNKLKFFELTTSTSWILQPGEYDFHSVKIEYIDRNEDAVLKKAKPPETIIEAFRHRIGGDTVKRYAPKGWYPVRH